MDIENLTEIERNKINEAFGKQAREEELTNDEINLIIDFNSQVIARDKYFSELEKEKEKTRAIEGAYREVLSDEAQKAFDEKIKSILGGE